MPFKCLEAKREYQRKWHLANKERRLEAAKERRKNPDWRKKYNEWMRRYRAKNGRTDRVKLSDQEKLHRSKKVQNWLASPRNSPSVAELVFEQEQKYWHRILYDREKSKRRKAAIRASMLRKISSKEIKSRFAEFDNACAYCGKPSSVFELHIEHFVPISKGGNHVLGNILPACKDCNFSKRDHDGEAWFREQPFFDKKRWDKILNVLGKSFGPSQQLSLL